MGAMYANAVSASTGEVITFLDDDDIFLPGKLEAIRSAFTTGMGIGYYNNWFSEVDDEGRISKHHVLREAEGRHRQDVGKITLEPYQLIQKLRTLPELAIDFCNSCVTVRRNVATSATRWLADERMFTLDTFLFFSALLSGQKICIDPVELTGYRVHPLNTSLNLSGAKAERQFERIDASYELILEMVKASENGEILREAKSLLLMHRIGHAFESKNAGRSEFLEYVAESKSMINTFRWNSRTKFMGHRGLQLVLLGFLPSPSLARMARSTLRGRGLSGG